MRTLITLLLLTYGLQAQALEFGCEIHPRDLNRMGSDMVRNFAEKRLPVPDSIPVQAADFDGNVDGAAGQVDGTLEGFYRPSSDDFYSLIPIPVLGISLSRERNMFYVCAHADKDPKKTHVTVYMMRGYHLDPSSLSTIIGNAVSGPQLKVKPLTAALVDITTVRKEFLSFLKWIPLMDVGLNAANGIQRLLSNILGDFTGIGVERLVMTMDGVEISTGVNLDKPDKAVIKKFIAFDKNKKN